MPCVKIVLLLGAMNVVNAVDVTLHLCVEKVVENWFVKNVNLHVSNAKEQDAMNALTTGSVIAVVKPIVRIVFKTIVRIAMW